jgi:hypothetical protein
LFRVDRHPLPFPEPHFTLVATIIRTKTTKRSWSSTIIGSVALAGTNPSRVTDTSTDAVARILADFAHVSRAGEPVASLPPFPPLQEPFPILPVLPSQSVLPLQESGPIGASFPVQAANSSQEPWRIVSLLVSHAKSPLQESAPTVPSISAHVSCPLQEPRPIDAVFSSQVGPNPLQESFAIFPEFWKQTSNPSQEPGATEPVLPKHAPEPWQLGGGLAKAWSVQTAIMAAVAIMVFAFIFAFSTILLIRAADDTARRARYRYGLSIRTVHVVYVVLYSSTCKEAETDDPPAISTIFTDNGDGGPITA